MSNSSTLSYICTSCLEKEKAIKYCKIKNKNTDKFSWNSKVQVHNIALNNRITLKISNYIQIQPARSQIINQSLQIIKLY